MKKITVIGDIMVEPPFMEQIGKNGNYDFYPSLAPLKTILEKSDYVIGNLETPLAGEEAGYTNRIVSFNAPDTLAEALKKLGVDAVSTTNNHCLDRGYEGLVRTNEVLDRYGIAHTGTYPEDFTGERILYFKVGDTTVALMAYTYATNVDINGVELTGERSRCVNKLRPLKGGKRLYEPSPKFYFDTKEYVEQLLGRKMIWEETIKLKIALHLPVPVIDDLVAEDEQDEYFRAIEEEYRQAREKADIVLFYPHVGGQFNELPGKYTQRLMQKCAKLGFDASFAAHSHTSQKAESLNGMPCFYSLGNVTMSPGTFYSVSECLPEYGLAAHMYIDEKKIQKVTFSIFKMVEEGDEPLHVVPTDDLYETLDEAGKEKLFAETASIYQRVTGKAYTGTKLCKEYDLC